MELHNDHPSSMELHGFTWNYMANNIYIRTYVGQEITPHMHAHE